MSGLHNTRSSWVDWFPIESEILPGTDGASELIVDMGGNKGHNLQKFLTKFPMSKGSLVLQDLPGLINSISKLQEGIRAIACDLLDSQLVKRIRKHRLIKRIISDHLHQGLELTTPILYCMIGRTINVAASSVT